LGVLSVVDVEHRRDGRQLLPILGMLVGHNRGANREELDYVARRHLRNSTAAQWTLPLAGVEAELARAAGDLPRARQVVFEALGREDLGHEPRYKWPLM
jgi:hypothetical protein